MSSIKNIKYKDNCLDKTIKQILNIHDSNITFSKDAVSKEKVHDRMATVFTGRLSYPSPRCECCGYDSVIHHGYKDSWIQLLPYQ
ncbi:ISL3 family transposase, partial [Enterococcus avium]|nr:ISL3 family transposase [Enterococcus avium]MDB1760709.1 ISL3 family transposase [Enterococcus avium]MDT2421272.1 ISL3 family transposase [Enterococcus avium]MDT2464816.1 ISL3 family transposase [Enterococcus avium]MDT2481637.1 ISL3 family transposase [Enterococcus avium]